MACRIQNLGKHRLALDLRGGRVVYLQPGELSQPLREEWLYGNVHLPGWLEQGVVRRLDASMDEVLAFEAKGREPPVPAVIAGAEAVEAETTRAADTETAAKPRGRTDKLAPGRKGKRVS